MVVDPRDHQAWRSQVRGQRHLRSRALCSTAGGTELATMLCDWRIFWVQIFRSIDSECTVGLCDADTDNSQAYDRGLVTGAAPARVMLA